LTLIFGLEVVKVLHDEVIRIRGERGIKSEGLLESCLERPFTYVYGHEAFPTLFMKAGALLHSIAGPFHPFIDGNKRTALLTTDLFLSINGYSFNFPNDVVDFMLSIAKGKINDIRKISRWIKKGCIKNIVYDINEDARISIYSDLHLPLSSGEQVSLRLKKI
jgi:death on curing protein